MNKWEEFFQKKIKKIFTEKKEIIDIGGGLRILQEKGNRFDKKRKWILPLLKNVNYKIIDPTVEYKPDIVGDIHNLPFDDNSIDAILCIAVLEHVENPFKASEEMYRSLKPGGYVLVYVPFIFYYHAQKGYYKDYWRFTKDGIDLLFNKFKVIEKECVRGPFATWIKLSPLGRIKLFNYFANIIDKIIYKKGSNQVSGYYVFLEK